MISTIVAALAHRRREHEQDLMREMSSAVTTLRAAVGDFRKQHGRYPHALNELPRIPRDPVTGSNGMWQTELEESVSADDFTSGSKAPEKFVVSVRSGAK